MNRSRTKNLRAFRAKLVGATAVAVLSAVALSAPATAQAQEAAQRTYDFDIPAQSLAKSVNDLALIAGVQAFYQGGEASGVDAPAVKGRMTVDQAISRLLAGTGYTYQYTRPGVIALIKLQDTGGNGDGERLLGAVRVEGAQGGGFALAGATVANGINGSRDVTATEGTGSYTSNALTVGSKTAQSIKDTPMAVSVITNQQIQDRNITDLNSAMRKAPGITATYNSSTNLNFYSRGFLVTQMQIDGGAAQNFTASPDNYRPVVDMSLYDHVEIVRGATGTFNGYGDPGGVVNLVRKRPLDHDQMLIEMQFGSWGWHRVSADVTGPIAFDGKLRARVIATHQDNNFFYDVAKAKRETLSGTLEFDVTPSTLVTGGITYQDQHDIPFGFGLMRYQTGDAIAFPRSTCLCVPWARDDRTNLEIFGQIDQRIGGNWNIKLKATRIRQNSYITIPSIGGAVDPGNGFGPAIFINSLNKGRSKQSLFEMTIDGGFYLFGQRQKIIVGANYSMLDPSGSSNIVSDPSRPAFLNGNNNGAIVGDIRVFNPDDWLISSGVNSAAFSGIKYGDFRTSNAYINFEFTPFSRFHVVSSLRYSGYRNRDLSYYICNPVYRAFISQCSGKPDGYTVYLGAGRLNSGSNLSWPPSVQIKYDVNNDTTVYLAYTDIYVSRSNLVTSSGSSLPPTTGGNFEGGVKWLSPGKNLNINLSGYYTKQINTDQIENPSRNDSTQNVGQLNQQIYCCFTNVDGAYNLSYGADLEISGEIYKNLQISASYNYNYNKAKNRPGRTNFDGSSAAIESQMPKHIAKIWVSYDFNGHDFLRGLRLGLGAQARSSTFVSDYYCPQTPVSTPTGPECPVDREPAYFTDPGYVVFNGSVGYRVNDQLRIDVEIENLLDKTYLDQVGGVNQGNWYGAPRSVKATLRGKF
jgi:outer-membrane receptor for ferric coprogen and ferric-rhodotorulic acid